MGIWFSISDKKKKANITVRELLKINSGLEQYSIANDSPHYNKVMDSVLSEFKCIYFGKKERCARGFETSWNSTDETLEVRISLLSSIEDWKGAIEFLVNMGRYLEVDEIEDDRGCIYTIEEIENYDYIKSIDDGIKITYATFQGDSFMIFGFNRDVHFSKAMLKEYIDSGKPAEEFSKVFTDCQYINAYSANQKLYRNDAGIIVGGYTITENLRTLIPYVPVVEYRHKDVLGEETVRQWFIAFVYVDGREDDPESYKSLGRMDYAAFMKSLPREKYSFIDSNNIVVEKLSKGEMEELLSKNIN